MAAALNDFSNLRFEIWSIGSCADYIGKIQTVRKKRDVPDTKQIATQSLSPEPFSLRTPMKWKVDVNLCKHAVCHRGRPNVSALRYRGPVSVRADC